MGWGDGDCVVHFGVACGMVARTSEFVCLQRDGDNAVRRKRGEGTVWHQAHRVFGPWALQAQWRTAVAQRNAAAYGSCRICRGGAGRTDSRRDGAGEGDGGELHPPGALSTD